MGRETLRSGNMNVNENWPEESTKTLKMIEGRKGYTLVLGVCFVYTAYKFLKMILPEVYAVRIQNGQLHHNYPFDKLKPSSILMCVAWGAMASCLEEPKHSGYINNYYIPILKSIMNLEVPTLILDFPGLLDRYCNLGSPQYRDIPAVEKGFVYRKEAEARGWKAQDPEDQKARKNTYYQKCMSLIAPHINCVSYFDLQNCITLQDAIHAKEVQMDYVSVAPWHWDDIFIARQILSFDLFLRDALRPRFFSDRYVTELDRYMKGSL